MEKFKSRPSAVGKRKVSHKGLSYNFACERLEKLGFEVGHVGHFGLHITYFFDKNGNYIAKYSEKTGILDVYYNK